MRIKTKMWHVGCNSGRIIAFTQNEGTTYAVVLMDYSKDYHEKYGVHAGSRLMSFKFEQFELDPPDYKMGF